MTYLIACDCGLSVKSCIAISLTKQVMSSHVTPPAFSPVVLGSFVLPSLFAVVLPDLVVLPPRVLPSHSVVAASRARLSPFLPSNLFLSSFWWPNALPLHCVVMASLSPSDSDRFCFAPHRFGGILDEVTSTIICSRFSHLSTHPLVMHVQ